MSGLKSKDRYFAVNAMTLAAQEWGSEGGLPVLALHGWLDNSASFERLAPLLPGIHLIALDMAGHGQSSHRPGVGLYSFWDDIHDLLAVADELGWQEFVLLGHSRGAIIGTLAAACFPERIKALALVEGFVPEPARAEDAPLQLSNALKGLKGVASKQRSVYPDVELAIKARERGMFPLSYAAASLLTRRGIQAVEGGFCWTSDPRLLVPSAVKLTATQINAFINSLSMPVCLLLAHEGLPKLYPHYLQHLHQYSHIKPQLLEGGHHLHVEDECVKVAEHLRDFFARFEITGL